MSTESELFYENWPRRFGAARDAMPETIRGFGGFFQNVMKPGTLSIREKELVALGIALAEPCSPCIHLHVEKSLQAGATREQILEAAGVAVMMRGGPTFTYLPTLIEALDAVGADARTT